jgi:cysteine desulfurase/selenocysteine lyase
VIKQIPLTKDFAIDEQAFAKLITSKSKVIAFASVSNTVGIFNDVKKIVATVKAKNPNLIVVVDATQEIGHRPVDVSASDVDFLAFSAHKMYGPFGVGVLYGKLS